MHTRTNHNSQLLQTFKSILQQQYFCSQIELADALSHRGYENISQAKISRMLKKIGAIRTRSPHNEMVYQLPTETISPKAKQSVNSMVLGIHHNGVNIVLRTILGGGSVISRILENMGEKFGILGCIADDNTILVIPSAPESIEETVQSIKEYLDIKHL